MPHDPNSIDSRARAEAAKDPAGETRRTADTWALIVAVWTVGIASWAVWLGAIGWMLVKVLAA